MWISSLLIIQSLDWRTSWKENGGIGVTGGNLHRQQAKAVGENSGALLVLSSTSWLVTRLNYGSRFFLFRPQSFERLAGSSNAPLFNTFHGTGENLGMSS